MSATALLARTLEPTEAEVRQELSGNLCRCTGYSKIIDAILQAGRDLKLKRAVGA
jgi:carbon-monoxide dehydrogenase small subunit